MKAVLLLGSNLGDRQALMLAAAHSVEKSIGSIIVRSKIYESPAWGFECGDDFLNQVLVVETALRPLQLLDAVHCIESEMGRQRSESNLCGSSSKIYSSRTMDIDILFYDDLIYSDNRLTIPHPLIAQREFVLKPLREIIPDFVHPVTGKKIKDL